MSALLIIKALNASLEIDMSQWVDGINTASSVVRSSGDEIHRSLTDITLLFSDNAFEKSF